MLLFEWGSYFVTPDKKEYIMAFDNLLKALRNRAERQKKAYDETMAQIKELESVVGKK